MKENTRKKNKVSFKYTENGIIVKYKKKSYTDILHSPTVLTCTSHKYAGQNLATICVSEKLFSMYNTDKLILINLSTNHFINVSLVLSDKLAEDECRITNYISEQLHVYENDQVLLCSYYFYSFNRVLTQKIDNIRENNLVVSPHDYRAIQIELKHSPCHLFEIYNTITKESLIVKKSHIFVDDSLPQGSMRLNRKQRICLGVEVPAFLSQLQWDLLKKNIPPEDVESMNLITTLYGPEDHILVNNATYAQKQQAKKILDKYIQGEIHIIPVIDTLHAPDKKHFFRKLSDFYVGKSTISLICRRPYDNDEGLNVVRLSKSNMKLLGVEEMDKVFLQYKKRKISCRVLELDKEAAFLNTNLPVPVELAIGVPAHLRKKLGVTDLNSVIKIDRDTGFIFRRSMNEQVVPILLTLFSTSLFSSLSAILPIVLSIVAVPIVVFFNLSSKRNMRA